MTSNSFGPLRSLLFPVYPKEYRKFIAVFAISFFSCFNYYILKITKDTILTTAPNSGAEATPFIKVWGVLPAAVLISILFTKLYRKLDKRAVFYSMVSLFVIYFTLFVLFLYPYRDLLHPHALANYLESVLPRGFNGLIAIIRNWTFATFYIMAEMWSTMIMSVLFWGFVNDISSFEEAKRFYGLFTLGTNLSGIPASLIVSFLSRRSFSPSFPFGSNVWDQSLTCINLIVIGVSIGIILLFWWLNRKGLGYRPEDLKIEKEFRVKKSFREHCSLLSQSKYLILIATFVIACNIIINLAETPWKDQVKQLYPMPTHFNDYMAQVNLWSVAIAIFTSIFISGNAIRILGWKKSALIPPILFLITAIFFFGALLVKKEVLYQIAFYVGLTPLALTTLLGSIQNGVIHGIKLSLYNAVKEMAFIPLSPQLRAQGKAAIDGVGSRLGKSGGSIIYQILLIIFGSILSSTLLVALILLLLLIAWICSTYALGSEFEQLSQEKKAISVPVQ